MKIVVLAPVHQYDDVRVFRKEATSLANAGNDVTLFARTPQGRPLNRNGVAVLPVRDGSRPLRFLNLLPLAVKVARSQADVYHLHNPDTLPIGFALRLLRRTVVYDTHEDFATEILLRQWIPSPIRRMAAGTVTWLEGAAGRWFAAVIVTQEQLLRRIPQAVVIGNPPILDEARGRRLADERVQRAEHAARGGREEDNPPAVRKLTLGYIGGLSQDRGLDHMMDLLAELNLLTPTRLLLAGPAVNDDALARAQERPEWRWVDYRGALPQEEAFDLVAQADAGLILFEDTASHRHIDPNKIYEYLALSVPFIASGFPDWRERFAGHNVGIFLDPEASAEQSAQVVLQETADRTALRAKGRAGLDFLANTYSWGRSGAPKLLALYERIRPRPGITTPRGSRSQVTRTS